MCSRISSHPSPITTCCHDYEPWLRPLTHKSLSGYLCGLVVVGPCEMYPTFMINRWWNGGYCIIFIMHCESRVDVPRSILFVTCLHNFKSILTFAFNTVHATYSLIDLTLYFHVLTYLFPCKCFQNSSLYNWINWKLYMCFWMHFNQLPENVLNGVQHLWLNNSTLSIIKMTLDS